LFGFYSFIEPLQAQQPTLFGNDSVLAIRLSGNIHELFNDRGDNATYHPLVLSYKGADGNDVSFTLQAKTRGHFRKDKVNCIYPPVLLNFQKSERTPTIFADQNKLKLVTSCRGDKYVIHEYLVYKLYNLLTPKSFRARLVQMTFYDTIRKKEISFYGMLLEEASQMAKRNGVSVLSSTRMSPQHAELETFLKMAMFQYMIGNTDWSVEYLHNIKAIAFDSLTIPYTVPYDFDHAGIVDAPYAVPAAELQLSSTHERRYRGYCIPDMEAFTNVVTVFNNLKPEFYKVYTGCQFLDSKYIAATVNYLDAFYETINNPKKLKAAFGYPCNKNVPKIVIGGLENKTDEDSN
jgi:hypothetical protein